MITVEVHSHDFKVDKALQDYVDSRASKLDKYINGVEEAKVDLSYRPAAREAGHRYKAQITLRGKKFVLRAEERSEQVQSAFDVALERIQRQVERYKGKHYRGKGDGASITDEDAEKVAALYEEDEPVAIARRKKFLLHPMDELEAIEQMRLLGHEDFFVFYNMEANGVSVLYKRGDGSFGLIDTEMA